MKMRAKAMTNYYEVKISAENQEQADVILDSLLAKKLVTGGQFLIAPARFLWKGTIENMKEYVTITSYTTNKYKDAVMEDVRKTSAEDFPMITFVVPDDLNQELRDWIDKTLG
jgi:uncharacterized protein involved in tolerance to divalent cations